MDKQLNLNEEKVKIKKRHPIGSLVGYYNPNKLVVAKGEICFGDWESARVVGYLPHLMLLEERKTISFAEIITRRT